MHSLTDTSCDVIIVVIIIVIFVIVIIAIALIVIRYLFVTAIVTLYRSPSNHCRLLGYLNISFLANSSYICHVYTNYELDRNLDIHNIMT